MKKKSTSDILLRNLDRSYVDTLREKTGQNAGSKAFIEAADRYLKQLGEIKRLESQNRRLGELLERLVPLCNQVIEIAGRESLLD